MAINTRMERDEQEGRRLVGERIRGAGRARGREGTAGPGKRLFSKGVAVCLKTFTLVTGNNRLEGHKKGRRKPS